MPDYPGMSCCPLWLSRWEINCIMYVTQWTHPEYVAFCQELGINCRRQIRSQSQVQELHKTSTPAERWVMRPTHGLEILSDMVKLKLMEHYKTLSGKKEMGGTEEQMPCQRGKAGWAIALQTNDTVTRMLNAESHKNLWQSVLKASVTTYRHKYKDEYYSNHTHLNLASIW